MIGAAPEMSGCAEGSVLRALIADSSVPSGEFEDSTLETANAAKCDLAGQVLRAFGRLRLRVLGSSMIPSLWPGDVLLVHRRDIGGISTGEIVLFAREGRLFAHRVVSSAGESGGKQVVTQGDALRAPDPPVTSAELLGSVSLVFRAGKWTAPRAGLNLGRFLLATLVRRSTRVAGLLLRLRSIRPIGREQEAQCES
jgi:signal peptidase I